MTNKMGPRILQIRRISKREETKLLYEELSYKIIGAAMEVHKILGAGFLEAVYEEAQLQNYLKATRIRVGLLFNFGEESLNYKRIIC